MRYLNLWVCEMEDLLGYGQFPGGPAQTDGVVIDHQAFGTSGTATPPFALGRTATHEIAHWLNLFHIWGDDGLGCVGNDFVDDAPNQAGPNTGMPTFPSITCGNGPDGDMFVNFMDYTDDAGMVMFTAGQAIRMRQRSTGRARRSSWMARNRSREARSRGRFPARPAPGPTRIYLQRRERRTQPDTRWSRSPATGPCMPCIAAWTGTSTTCAWPRTLRSPGPAAPSAGGRAPTSSGRNQRHAPHLVSRRGRGPPAEYVALKGQGSSMCRARTRCPAFCHP